MDLRETLHIYLAASNKAMSSILIKEEEGNRKLIYFTNGTLQRIEKRLEKLTLALISATRKLNPYFQNHQVIV